MSKITIFNKTRSLVGDFSIDQDAISIVNCDDRYDSKFLDIVGKKHLDAIKEKSRKWQHYVEITNITQ